MSDALKATISKMDSLNDLSSLMGANARGEQLSPATGTRGKYQSNGAGSCFWDTAPPFLSMDGFDQIFVNMANSLHD